MKVFKHFGIIFSFLVLTLFNTFAQLMDQNPTSLNWSQINSSHYKLIFEKGIDSVGIATSKLLEKNYLSTGKTLNVKSRPITILIQNQNTVSNGFVTLTPRRSEFFITPPQDYTLLGTGNWIDLLVKHELRHVVQYDKALVGFSKFFHTIFGNNGLAVLSHIATPNWFWEGDAVGTETELSDNGRGRISAFNMLMRAQLLTDKPFSYNKACVRSFKDFVPNHYPLGYHLTNYLKEKKGTDVWDKILTNNYKIPIFPFSFSKNIKNVYGQPIEKMYVNAMVELKNKWQNEVENKKLYENNYLPITKTNIYTDYEYPQAINEKEVIAIKSGLSHIAQIVKLDSVGQEHNLFELGNWNDGSTLSVENGKVVWAELLPDARWTMRNYSSLKILALNSKKVTRITTKTKIAAPAFNKTASKIVGVATLPNGKNFIHILNASDGSIENSFTTPQNWFFQQPSFSEDGSKIVAVASSEAGKSLLIIDIETGNLKLISTFSKNNFAHPILHDSIIVYNNSVNGIDNVFAVNINSKVKYQLTNAKFGAFNGVIVDSGKALLFTDFTSKGHRVTKMHIDMNSFQIFTAENQNKVLAFGNYINDAKKEATPEKDTMLLKPHIKSYSKWNIFNINSWGPLFGNDGLGGSIGLQTQNMLSTMATDISVGYNAIEKQTAFRTGFSYQGFYPVIDFTFENAGRSTIIPKNTIKDQTTDIKDNWRQQSINLGLSLPFNFTRNKFKQTLSVSSTINYLESQGYDLPGKFTGQLGKGSLTSITNVLRYSFTKKAAKRDVMPRYAHSILLYSRNTPFTNGLIASLNAVQFTINLPGFTNHDGFKLKANIMNNGKNNEYNFSSPILFPRGYDFTLQNQIKMVSAEYKIPLGDPDLSIGRFFHFQRVIGGLFIDKAQGYRYDSKNKKIIDNYTSVGIDLSTMVNFMRFSEYIQIGVRANYLPNEKLFKITPLIVEIPF